MEYTFLQDSFFNNYNGNTYTSVDKISVGNTSVNVAANSTAVTVGANAVVNTSTIKIGNVVSNTTTLTTANNVSIDNSGLIIGPNSINTTSTNLVTWTGGFLVTNGMTLSTTPGLFYSMDVATQPTANLPNTANIADGYNVTIRCYNVPSGYQTSYVQAEAGKNIEYRGFLAQRFYFIGLAEIFRFTWVSSANIWIAECLKQPGSVLITRSLSSSSWNSGQTSFTPLPLSTTSGNVPAAFSWNSNWVRTPIIGIFESNYRVYISATAGGGVSGTGYLVSGDKAASSYDSSYAYKFQLYMLNNDYSYLEINWTTLFNSGQYSLAWHLESSTGLWYFPGNNYGRFELVSR